MLRAAVALGLLWAPAPSAGLHPLHSALTEVSYAQDSQAVLIRIRLFADDLTAALSQPPGSPASDSVLSRYVRGTLALSSQTGHPLVLRWQGAERVGDTVLLRLQATLAGGLEHARILPALLWERFPDQVNIVRATYADRTITLLFTRGDAEKTIL
jgi:hypothetical protein